MHLVQGCAIMCNDMQVRLGQFMASWSSTSNQIWFGDFSPLQFILGAKATNVAGDTMYFNGDGDGKLHVYFASGV